MPGNKLNYNSREYVKVKKKQFISITILLSGDLKIYKKNIRMININ